MKRLFAGGLALAAVSMVLRRDTEPVFYAFERGGETGIAQITVNRPKERLVEHRELATWTNGARVLGLRVTNDPLRAVVALEVAERDNVFVIDPAATESSRVKRLSLPGTPSALTNNDEDMFVACGSRLTRVEVQKNQARERFEFADGRGIDALARFDDDGLVLATHSGPSGPARLTAFDEDDLEVEFEVNLPTSARRFELLAVSEELGLAISASRENSALVVIDLDEADDDPSRAVSASLVWNDAPGAVTESLCVSADDGRTAYVFGSGVCAAIDLRAGLVLARADGFRAPSRSFHLATPHRAIVVGAGTDRLWMLGLDEKPEFDVRTVKLDEAALFVAPVEPRTCVQVVALGARRISLVRIDLERVNDTLDVLGKPLAIASPFDR